MTLEDYREKRKLDETPEPSGGESSEGLLRFVIQKHAATRLHYDLRLEMNGVLKSWAVPKGPSLSPGDKRLAVMVEDHPLDYQTFEGIIPEGNYGAGTVMIWDRGEYDSSPPAPRAEAEQLLNKGLEKGHISFILHGVKLTGEFALVKMRGRGENDWLLIKANDGFASDQDILEQDRSAATDRTMEQISAESAAPALEDIAPDLAELPDTPIPRGLKPMLSTLVDEPFDRTGWIFEIKWDGYRAIGEVEHGDVRLVSRAGLMMTEQFPQIVDSLKELGFSAVLDGEIVVLDEAGVSRFELLQGYSRNPQGHLVYYAFDLLWLNGKDLRELPLARRKEILAKILPDLPRVRLSAHIAGKGRAFFDLALAKGLEGIIGKDANGPYRAGFRGREWAKLKVRNRILAVIAGYTEPRGGRQGFGALLLGAYRGGELIYIGHAGGGFDDKTLVEVYNKLKPLEQSQSPFQTPAKPNMPAHWVEPKLVCEVIFAEWTNAGRLRAPIFAGLREDKEAREVKLGEKGTEPFYRRKKGSVPFSPEPVKSNSRHGTKTKINDRELWLTNQDKVYWPDEGYTKGDLIAYYRDVASFILPHLIDRPESLHRFPNGIRGESFYHKDVTETPDWVQTTRVRSESEDKDITYVLCQDEASLVYLANLGCIELNPWLSRVQALDKPDYLVIDLDPEEIGFDKVVEAALVVRGVLEEAGAPSVVKTSGASGMHIYVPLGARYEYEHARTFAMIVAQLANARLPETTSVLRPPEKRPRRVYLDYLQNRRGQTLAAPYSVRPRPGATVSTPLLWDEVNPNLAPTAFTIKTIRRRLDKLGDIFAPALGEGADLIACLERLSAEKQKAA